MVVGHIITLSSDCPAFCGWLILFTQKKSTMKLTKQKKQLLGLTLVLIASVMMIGFTYKSQTKSHSSRLLMVGIGYGQKKCGSSSFSEAISYEYYRDCFGGNYSDITNRIKKQLYDSYGVDESNVSIKSSTKSYAVIVSYNKEIPGWGCSVKRYAVGFGNNYDEALQDAVSVKKADDAGSRYNFQTFFYCNN